MSETVTFTPSVTPTMGLVQFDHGGETVKYYNNSASELPAGLPIIQGGLFGVPVRPIAAYSWGALVIEGSMTGPKAANDAGLTAGALAYWDAGNSVFTSTGSGNTYAGKVEYGMGTNGTPGAIATADTVVWVQIEAAANASGSVGLGALPRATVAAAGTNVGTAGALATGFNSVTAADGTKGVVLPTAPAAGTVVRVKNTANAVLKVYPDAAATINAIAANAAISMAAYTSADFTADSTTQWYTTPLVPS